MGTPETTCEFPSRPLGSSPVPCLRVRATFLWDGFVRGTWKVEGKKDAATLHVTPCEALPEPQTISPTAIAPGPRGGGLPLWTAMNGPLG